MKKAKASRVPVLENAFEVNLPKLIRAAKATGSSRLVLDDGDLRTVAVLAESRLAVLLGGRNWMVDIVAVHCLKGRLRPLLKCPHAHEGNFQSLFYRNGDLACRHCHSLRYRTNLAATVKERTQLARVKFLASMGTNPGHPQIVRQPYKWRKRYLSQLATVARLTSTYYKEIHSWLSQETH